MRRLGPRQRRRDDDSEQERERDENRAERTGRDRRHRRGQHGHDAHERDESTVAQHDSVPTSRLYVDRARCARRWHFCAEITALPASATSRTIRLFASAIELPRLLPARRPGDLIVQTAPASSTALPSGPAIDLRTLLTAAAIGTLSSIDVQDKSREPLAPPAATLDAQKSGSAATHAGSG